MRDHHVRGTPRGVPFIEGGAVWNLCYPLGESSVEKLGSVDLLMYLRPRVEVTCLPLGICGCKLLHMGGMSQ